MRRFAGAAAALLVSVAGSASAQARPPASAYEAASRPLRLSHVAPDILRLDGEIGSDDAPAFLAALTPEVRTLLVNSVGGEVSAALDMAEAVERRGLRVAVAGICASSCANYLFGAARERLVLPGGVVIWHGGVTAALVARMRPQMLEVGKAQGWAEARTAEFIDRELAKAQAMRARQDALYRRRGLDGTVLHRLNDFGADAEPVIGGEAGRGGFFMHIGPEALRCAGFHTSSFWTPQAEPGGWRAFLASTGLPADGLTRSPALERTLCAR